MASFSIVFGTMKTKDNVLTGKGGKKENKP